MEEKIQANKFVNNLIIVEFYLKKLNHLLLSNLDFRFRLIVANIVKKSLDICEEQGTKLY